jgi:ubiquitin carboxyl-terminal hydrolase 8
MNPTNAGGLLNMGLTCYGNAVIQNLRHLSKLQWILEEDKYTTLFNKKAPPRRRMNQELTSALAEIFHYLRRCKKGQTVRPGNFWSKLIPAVRDTLYEQFAMKTFHDSHEFFQLVLETLHQSTIQDVDMRITRPPPTSPREGLIHAALQAWQQSFAKEYSPFVHMFYGLYHQKTVCQECKNCSHRWEPFNSLKVPIPTTGECDILNALHDDLLHEEIIEEYVCDSCGPPRRQAKKSMSIWKLPLVLVLSVKRFTNDGKKINTRVKPLPMLIDCARYFSADSPELDGNVHYTLRGIVDHHGGSGGGHYTAQCLSTVWNRYDDENVETIPGPTFGDTTYMAFLERA